MKKVGLVIGKFAPLTTGHINLINTAVTECERVIVVVSHHQDWLAKQSPRDQKILTLNNRMRWLNEVYGDVDSVRVEYVDETSIPEFPNGWTEYAELIRQNYGALEDVSIFSSEIDYDPKYRELLPEFGHVVVDSNRTRVPISATAIRSDLYGNWSFLPSVVRRDYAKKICIIGMESCGKTTLTKMLAKLYNTSWVEEYGRTFCVQDLHMREDLLVSKDYETIAIRQKELEEQALRTANRIVLCDTNAFITQYYHYLYEGSFNPIVDAFAKSEQYDFVILLRPTVPWVDDGLRLNSDRERSGRIFDTVLARYPNQMHPDFTVTIDSTDYRERMDLAIEAIDGFLAKVENGEL